jgi:RNA recognition motif-containing protein
MNAKIYVANLPFHTTEQEILELFQQEGNVSHCRVAVDRFTNKSRGCAFVEMPSQTEADHAIAALNGAELDGRVLRVGVLCTAES